MQTLLSLLGLFGLLPALALGAARPPNIVLIVSDDQGYGDIGCQEHPPEVRTPNLDALAAQGVRFTSGYASAYVCAPTRASLLTGRYQQRFGFYTASDSRAGLPVGERTLADLLRGAGYATGVFGKWHLGLEKPFHPLRRGFGEFYGFLGHGAHDYFKLEQTDDHNSIWRNDQRISDTGYLTDNLAREAVAFIRRHRDRPFFLYLPFNAVHWPLQAPETDIARFHTGQKERDIYLAMLHRMDLAVGQVLDTVRETGLAERTLTFFLSDNGGARNTRAHNGPLRDFKHSVYEGGIRVPFLLSWPGQIPAGRTCSEPVISHDIFVTACAAAGVSLPGDRTYDGKNLLPAARGESGSPLHPALFWDGDEGKRAVRSGAWKLVDHRGTVELYDLDNDLGESRNLAGQHPELVARLQQQFEKWRAAMAPRIRTPNPAAPGREQVREERRRQRLQERREPPAAAIPARPRTSSSSPWMTSTI